MTLRTLLNETESINEYRGDKEKKLSDKLEVKEALKSLKKKSDDGKTITAIDFSEALNIIIKSGNLLAKQVVNEVTHTNEKYFKDMLIKYSK